MVLLVPKNPKHEEKYSGGKPVLTRYEASAHTKAHTHSSSSSSNNNNNNKNNNNNRKNAFVLIWKSRFIEGW
jgi:hypothetical protein